MDFYVSSLLGGYLGYLQSSVNIVTRMIYLILLLMVTVGVDTEIKIKLAERITYFAAFIFSVGLCFAAMLLQNTSFGSITVQGVQGRYFLPVLILGLLSIRPNSLVFKKKPYSQIIFGSYFFGVFSMLQIVVDVIKSGM